MIGIGRLLCLLLLTVATFSPAALPKGEGDDEHVGNPYQSPAPEPHRHLRESALIAFLDVLYDRLKWAGPGSVNKIVFQEIARSRIGKSDLPALFTLPLRLRTLALPEEAVVTLLEKAGPEYVRQARQNDPPHFGKEQWSRLLNRAEIELAFRQTTSSTRLAAGIGTVVGAAFSLGLFGAGLLMTDLNQMQGFPEKVMWSTIVVAATPAGRGVGVLVDEKFLTPRLQKAGVKWLKDSYHFALKNGFEIPPPLLKTIRRSPTCAQALELLKK